MQSIMNEENTVLELLNLLSYIELNIYRYRGIDILLPQSCLPGMEMFAKMNKHLI